MAAEHGRTLRADAQENLDRLLDAATLVLARDGADATLKSIASEAGLGIGTLYRHFPTREQLVWAVYRSEVERICAQVTPLLARHSAEHALRLWFDEFHAMLASKEGMADALKAALSTDEVQRLETRHLLTGALGTLLEAGVASGSIRSGVDALDVMMALGGTALIAGDPGQERQASRLLDLLMRGLLA